MSKIRMPRKKKKGAYWRKINACEIFPQIIKADKFYKYLDVERYIKLTNLTPIQLCYKFGKFTLDHVVWWYYINKKYLNKELEMDSQTQEYWDWFREQGVIDI